jgi:hypothetical protein
MAIARQMLNRPVLRGAPMPSRREEFAALDREADVLKRTARDDIEAAFLKIDRLDAITRRLKELIAQMREPDLTDPDNPEMTAEEFDRAVPVINGDWEAAIREAKRRFEKKKP